MIALLVDLNFKCWKDHVRRFANVYKDGRLDYYTLEQIQERDRAGWTEVCFDGMLIAIINWQAGGQCIYSVSEEFLDDLFADPLADEWFPCGRPEIVSRKELHDLGRKIEDIQ